MTTRKNQNKIKSSKSKSEEPSKEPSTIGVYLRIRPIKPDESTIQKINDQQVKTLPPHGSIPPQVYSFTKVFDNAQQSQIFEQVAQPIVEDFIVSARDGLIFTYGITGSGKTYTMEGTRNDPGLIFRSIDFIFNSIASQQTPKSVIETDGQNSYRIRDQEPLYPNLARSETPSALPSVIKWRQRSKETAKVDVDHTKYFALFISLVELYNKQVHDLFEDAESNSSEKKKREIRTDPRTSMSYVANCVELEVKSAEEAVDLYTRGIRRRRIGSTALNQESSRGHCVLNLRLVQASKNVYNGQFDEDTLVASQLCLVDLAGSERTKRSGVTGGALHEAGSINNSLGALRKCIRALRDREPTSNIQYREYSLTRLFKSYFEGHGLVRMVLCVKPTIADFYENNTAMEFGFQSQDVLIDYASPPKMIKRSRSRAQDTLTADMQELLEKKSTLFKPNPDLSDEEFISDWINKLKKNRDERKKCFKVATEKQRVFRVNILETVDSNASLKQLYETRAKDLKNREEQLELLESKLHTTERSREQKNEKIRQLQRKVSELDSRAKQAYAAEHKFEMLQAQNENAHRKLLDLVKSEQNRSENFKEIQRILSNMKPRDWVSAAPSAPEMEPLQSSSPIDIPNPSTTETTDSHTVPTLTNSSSDAMEYHQDHRVSSSPIKVMSSPTGVPVVNPRHERSLSCSNMRWIHHKPQGTIDTGTVMRPKFKNGRSVKNLQSSDILRKDAAGYSLVHQDADPNGDVETSVYKGRVVSTVCGGAQVILNDIETMRQVSPKRRRASIAQFNN